MQEKKFTFKARTRSFRYAFKGIATLVRSEHNARIHLCAALCAIAAGIGFGITATEWIAVVLSIGIVFSAEAVNSAIEYLADTISPEHHPLIGKAKDIAAAAVLLTAIAAATTGCIIFIPRIAQLFN